MRKASKPIMRVSPQFRNCTASFTSMPKLTESEAHKLALEAASQS